VTDRTHLTTVEEVREERSWLFTARDQYGEPEEILLVPCEDGSENADNKTNGTDDEPGVEAWVNRCTHEAQKLDRGFGAAMRDGQIICPKHGSMFDSCSGYCDNGEAADTTLVSVDITVENGQVHLVDDDVSYLHDGTSDDDGDDDVPGSTSHLQL